MLCGYCVVHSFLIFLYHVILYFLREGPRIRIPVLGNTRVDQSWHSGQFHSVYGLIHYPDEIRHNSAGIPAVPFKEPLPAYSPNNRRRAMYLYRVAVVRSGRTRINSAACWNVINLSSSAPRLKAKIIYIISKATSCTYVKGLSANDAGEIIRNWGLGRTLQRTEVEENIFLR
jgi:hypothetical protein